MVKVVKKVKKSLKGISKPSVMEQSPYRPRYVEKRPPCSGACPNGEQVREFLQFIAQSEDYGRSLDESLKEAFYIITKTNPFPSTTGRVCPHPCESECNRKDKDESVNINACEMYVGDYAIEEGLVLTQLTNKEHKERIAIIGSGPSGLSCAYHLARRGFGVVVFEKDEKPGGLLRYGIPNFRLPKSVVDAEIKRITELGVEIRCNAEVGKTITIDEIKKEFDAIYLAIGTYKVDKPPLEGIDSIKGIYSGLDFLKRHASGEKLDVGSNVIVIGADTASDAAMISRRLNAQVTFAYRRTIADEAEFQDRASKEAKEAFDEDIAFQFATAPKKLIVDNGKLSGVEFDRIKVESRDSRGHASKVSIVEGSSFFIKASTLVYSVGQKPDYTGFENILDGMPEGFLKVKEDFSVDESEKIFAGGDVIGPRLMYVTTAIGHGFAAAMNIIEKLTGKNIVEKDERRLIESKDMHLDLYEAKPRNNRSYGDPQKRVENFEPFMERFVEEEFINETKRCMSCGLCFDCGNCFMYCSHNAVKKLPKGKHYELHLETCDGCMKCFDNCLCGYIDKV